MSRMSWDEGFAHRYDEWAAHMTDDVAFYVGLARQADGPLVELAVGTGRVAIPVAQATGRPPFGARGTQAPVEGGCGPRASCWTGARGSARGCSCWPLAGVAGHGHGHDA